MRGKARLRGGLAIAEEDDVNLPAKDQAMKTKSSLLRTPLFHLALLVAGAVAASCDSAPDPESLTGARRRPDTETPDAAGPQSVDGAFCLADADCESGVCATYYWDLDGDGYGSGTVRACGRQPPADTSTQGGDCCDSAAEAHPGAMAYHDLRNACGTHDYNCDGVEQKDRPATAACGSIDAGGSLSAVACR